MTSFMDSSLIYEFLQKTFLIRFGPPKLYSVWNSSFGFGG
jgi:hypothetical protein